MTPVTTELLAVQPCCGVRHENPFLHRKWFKVGNMMRPYYLDGRKKVEVLECTRCYKTRHLENRKPRWCEPYSDMCAECMRAQDEALVAPKERDDFDPFLTIAKNKDMHQLGFGL